MFTINGLVFSYSDDFDLLSNINLDPAIITKPDSKYRTLVRLLRMLKNPSQIKFASPAKPNLYILAIG